MTLARLRSPIAVSLGAIAGALSRYYLGGLLVTSTGLRAFPIGTLGANLLGCLLMGLFIALTYKYETLSPEIRLMVATGFLGSLTTFSSYELEVSALVHTGQWHIVLLYWFGSPVLGLACLYGGLALGKASDKPAP